LTWDVLDRRDVPAVVPLFGAGSALANAFGNGLATANLGNVFTTGTNNLAAGSLLGNALNLNTPFANGAFGGAGLGTSLLGNIGGAGLGTSLLGNSLTTPGGLATANGTLPFFGGLNNSLSLFGGGLNGALPASSLGGLFSNLGLGGAFSRTLASPFNSALTTTTPNGLFNSALTTTNPLLNSGLLNSGLFGGLATGNSLGLNSLSALNALNSGLFGGTTTTGTNLTTAAALLNSGLTNSLLPTTGAAGAANLTGNIPFSAAALTGNVPFTGFDTTATTTPLASLLSTGLLGNTTATGSNLLNGFGSSFSAGAFTPSLPVITADPSSINGFGSGLFHPGVFGASGLNGAFSVPTTSATTTFNNSSLFV
jgi:hypothetical protein